nr:peptidoglycan-binding protein [Rhizobium sp. Khangiran2]
MQTIPRRAPIALAVVSAVATLCAHSSPAQAITLLDIIRGGPANRAPVYNDRLPGVETRERQVDPQPLPKVTGPKYHAYKPDAVRAVRTTGFAVAGNDASPFADAKVSASEDVAAAIESFYGKNATPLWVSNGDVTSKAQAVIELFERADAYGLDPADYRVAVPELLTASTEPVSATMSDGMAAVPGDGHRRALMQFELDLSASVLRFAQDMVRGRLDPNRISDYHDFKRKDVKLAFVLPFVRAEENPAAYLEGLAPQSPQFMALKAELARLKAKVSDRDQRIELPDDLLLKPGTDNPAVAGVVAAIREVASDELTSAHAETLSGYQDAGKYTPELVELVKAFQKEAGLKPDGVVGRATVRALVGHSDEAKIEKLVIAMEQARWLPTELGERYVFINQPAYMAYYHEDGDEQLSMRVVVGSKSNQTYFFQDEIETVEFNPYWGVPQSIIINEMLPHLRSDPSYLDRMGYQVEVNGRPVSSSSVNWYGSTQAIAVRQPPSSDNALGELKILFPNAHAIYMHDTPSKSYFQRDTRALSHGCIRLAEPRKMAAAVLGVTEQEIGSRIAGGRNKGEKVTAKIPVYVSYFTAWPNKDGVVEYFDDVYDRDAATLKAMAATTKARTS